MSNKCADMGSMGQWYDAAEKACHNGLYHTVTFNLRALKLKLPQRIVYGVSYNSDHHGPNPLGGTNAPEDSLNLALSPATTTGKQVFPGGMFWDTSYLGFTCGDATNGIGAASGFVARRVQPGRPLQRHAQRVRWADPGSADHRGFLVTLTLTAGRHLPGGRSG